MKRNFSPKVIERFAIILCKTCFYIFFLIVTDSKAPDFSNLIFANILRLKLNEKFMLLWKSELKKTIFFNFKVQF